MVDPKMVELNVYNGIPHLLAPVVTDPKRASLALKKIVVEMEKRYELFSKSGTRNIEGYNNLMKDNPDAFLPYIVVIVDELADLMMVSLQEMWRMRLHDLPKWRVQQASTLSLQPRDLRLT